ncbi:MAG: hypothetical protein KHY75_12855 [Enterococcus faecium]|nr:hypothetical protein [Enterococcus faecium]
MEKPNNSLSSKYADSALDIYRVPNLGACWWCGNKATTGEHKIKQTDLRRLAYRKGSDQQDDIYRFGESFSGILRSLKKGNTVRWGKNLCANCNNARSQPFDEAYVKFMDFYIQNFNLLYSYKILDWSWVYGRDWQQGAANLARYFAKQFGCMMATEDLPVPQDIINFANGDLRCPSAQFAIWRDHRIIKAHKTFRKSKDPVLKDAMSYFIGLPETMAGGEGGILKFSQYQCRVGYLGFDVIWEKDTDLPSFHEYERINLPKINSSIRKRVEWIPMQMNLTARSLGWGRGA